MRPRADYADMHAAADRLEPRLARAFARAVERIRAGVSINDLAMAIAAKDAKRAQAIVSRAAIKDALGPAGAIVSDAVLKGGRVGAGAVNRARRA